MAIRSTLKLVCKLGSIFYICIYGFVRLYVPYPVFFFQCMSLACLGGSKDPSV